MTPLAGPLRALDLRLSDALRLGEPAEGPPAAALERDLLRPAGTPRYAGQVFGRLTEAAGGRLAMLAHAFGLDGFELDVVLVALAPEIDRRYGQTYAFLQGDAGAMRPGAELALDLLCADAAERFARAAQLAPEAPLFSRGILNRAAETTGPALGLPMMPDDQVTRFLLDQDGLPRALATFCRIDEAKSRRPAVDAGTRSRLQRIGQAARRTGGPVRCVLQGSVAESLHDAAVALATAIGATLLHADFSLLERDRQDAALRAVVLVAQLRGALLCLSGLTVAAARDRERLEAALIGVRTGVVVATAADWPTDAFDVVGVSPPDPPARLACWRRELAAARFKLADGETATLAARFTLSPAAIRSACRAARRGLAGAPKDAAYPALLRAVRAGRGAALSGMARRVPGTQDWGDLVLPEAQTAQLRALCLHVAQRHRVETEWGFAGKLTLGRGICALFAGPSGTGKTMAAGIVARALDLDLYRIDLAQTVSKFIGETEKNLDRIFDAAEAADAVLFFDEADALFGKRSEVKDAHDRYANLEVSYLLQKMEEYGGLAILATNLRQHLDEAFTRRLRAIVEFPFPDEAQRLRIWQAVFPRQAPLGADVDLAALAVQVRVAGGNIRNIALAAAFAAASEGEGPIGQVHLLAAAQAEYAKLGRTWTAVGPRAVA